MAKAAKRRSTSHLVDLQRGVVSREIFVNEALYQQEQEQVFARTWLFVGHESQIPKPGDYFTSCMGEESVILTRANQEHIHVFLNTCRHRGMKVCRYDEGNTAVFTTAGALPRTANWWASPTTKRHTASSLTSHSGG